MMRFFNLIFCQMLASVCIAQSGFATDASDLSQKAEDAYRHGKYDEVIECFDKLVDLNPNAAYTLRSLAYFQKGEYQKAMADANEVIHLNRDVNGFLIRGNIYAKAGESEKAIKDYDEAIQLSPKSGTLYMFRALQFERVKNYDAALIDCNTTILLLSDNPGDHSTVSGAYRLKGDLLAAKGDRTNAFDCFNQAIQFDSKNALAFSGRGQSFALKKDYVRAISDLTTALELSKSDAITYARLAWVLSTCPEAKLRDGQMALEYAKRACELSEWKVARWFEPLACANAETGNFDEAISWEEKFINSNESQAAIGAAKLRLELFKQKEAYHVEE